jgi:outer membrane murein-binding lipoprotein Lpp
MEALNWLPVIAAGASVVAVVRFWVDLGKVWRQAEEAAVTASTLAAKFSLLQADVSEHKVDVARNYATNVDLERAIDRLDTTLRQYLDAMERQRTR